MTPAPDRDLRLRQDLQSLRIDRDRPPAPRAKRWDRRLRWLALVAAGGVGLLAAGRFWSARPVEVHVAVAEPAPSDNGFMMPVLSGSGYVVTGGRYISIGVRVPGRIDRYFVEEGQSVRAGDALVQLDDRDYRAAVARAEAALRVAGANRALAEAELGRGRELRAQRVISQQELEVFETRAAVARASEMQAQAELTQAKVNLEYTTLRAPSDGVVLAKLKEVGEIAVPGGFAGSGDLIRLANLSDLRAEVDVNESDLNRVSMGQPAHVIPDAYPDLRYEAEVVKMYPQIDRQKGTLKVEVRIRNPDGRLLPDMSVRVSFLKPLTAERALQPGVLLPAAAIRRDSREQTFVWKMENGRVLRVPVTVIGQIGDRVLASGNLGTEATVVVSGDRELREGVAVNVIEQ